MDSKNNVFLAPLAGITDKPFRKICASFGASLVHTEMISARAMHYNDKKTLELLDIEGETSPVCVQIFGNEPDFLSEATKRITSMGFCMIDINMGCPTPKIVNNGDGSALMKDLKLAEKVLKAVVSSSTIPVSVKMRIGWDDKNINACELARIAESSGVSRICVHGRTREQFYSGSADRKVIADVKKAVKIPVIGNGDIFTGLDAVKMIDETGVDGVMIGRGSLGNPFIFREIQECLEHGNILTKVTTNDRIDMALFHFDEIIKYRGEYLGVREARKHIAWYVKGIKYGNKIRNEVFTLNDVETIKKLLKSLAS